VTTRRGLAVKALLIALTAIVVGTGPLWTWEGVRMVATYFIVAANVLAAVFAVAVLVGWPRRLARYFGGADAFRRPRRTAETLDLDPDAAPCYCVTFKTGETHGWRRPHMRVPSLCGISPEAPPRADPRDDPARA